MGAVDHDELEEDDGHDGGAQAPDAAVVLARAHHPGDHPEEAPDDGQAGLGRAGVPEGAVPGEVAQGRDAVAWEVSRRRRPRVGSSQQKADPQIRMRAVQRPQ